MISLKDFVKKYFGHFVFFYRYLGYRIFVSLALSLCVGVLDSFGLLMFLPLLQIVMGNTQNPGEGLGGLSFIVDGFDYIGLPLTLGTVLGIMALLFSFKAVMKFGQIYYGTIVRLFFIRSIRFQMADCLANYSYKAFVTSDAGRIQNTMSGEVSRVSQAYTSYFATIQSWIFLLVYFTMALVTNAQFSILVGLGGVLSNLVYRQIFRRTTENSKKISRGGHVFQRLLIQKVAFFKYLKATGFARDYKRKLKEAIVYIEEANRKIGFYGAILGSSREPIVLVVIAIVIFVQSTLSSGSTNGIIPSLIFFYRALQYVLSLQSSWNGFLASAGSLTNLNAFLNELDGAREKYGSIIFKGFQNKIYLDKVSFVYGQTRVLFNISIDIRKNTTIAFVGESGSGKTTLVNLLSGLMPVDGGRIVIDGVRYKELDIRTLQRRIGYITQDPVIFSDSIFDNVTQWAPKTPETLSRFWEACEKAAIAEFVRGLENCEDSALGNNGIQISGGQKQRISIARELYKDVDFLILDEATSALDSETERAIQENIEALKGKYTILIVAHRLSTIKSADVIYLLNKGELVDSGNYKELLEHSSNFRKMTALQKI